MWVGGEQVVNNCRAYTGLPADPRDLNDQLSNTACITLLHQSITVRRDSEVNHLLRSFVLKEETSYQRLEKICSEKRNPRLCLATIIATETCVSPWCPC